MKERVKTGNGNRIGVVINIRDYHRLLQELQKLDSIRFCDAAKTSGDEVVPFEQDVTEIEHC